MTNKIVICIPIALENRQDIASALLNRYSTNYVFIGRIFQETATNKSCQINIYNIDNNSNLTKEIAFNGRGKIALNGLQEIDCSKQIINLISADTGYQSCMMMARFTQILLNIGGLAVNIESAKIAHQVDKWLACYSSKDVFEIYSLYVGLVEGEDNYHSCGMHNFGKADVSIDLTEDISLAIYVMNVFNYYRLTESPILQDGHTFQPDIESPSYQIKLLEDEEHTADSWQHNSLGRWHLSRP